MGYKVYVGSLEGACRSSKVYGLSWKEMRVDVWGFWVVVGVTGLSWEDVGGDWWLISNFGNEFE